MISSKKKALPVEIKNAFDLNLMKYKSTKFYPYISKRKSHYKQLLNDKYFASPKNEAIVGEVFIEASKNFLDENPIVMETLKKETFSLQYVPKILDSFSIYYEENYQEWFKIITEKVLRGWDLDNKTIFKEVAKHIFDKYFSDRKGCLYCVVDTMKPNKPDNVCCELCKSHHVRESCSYGFTGKGACEYLCFHCWHLWGFYDD